jgi:hypothetical protein
LTENPCFTSVNFFSFTVLKPIKPKNRDKRPIQSFAYIINYIKKRIVNPVNPNQLVNTRQDPFFSDGFVQQPFYGSGIQGQLPYPGVNGYANYGLSGPSTALTTPSTSTGSSFNMSQIKGIIDRMGGIDGVMGHVSRIQKFIQGMQQMAPMFKVLMGSFGKARTRSKLDGDGLTAAGRRRRSSIRRKSGKRIYKRRSR